jgi:hypothetical protein
MHKKNKMRSPSHVPEGALIRRSVSAPTGDLHVWHLTFLQFEHLLV